MAETGTTLRIMTYNIRHGIGNHPEQPRTFGDLDLARVVRVISDTAPDIVGLQEVDRSQGRSGQVDQPAWMAEQLGMHACYGANVEMDGGEYGTAILSRFPMSDAANTLLPTYDHREQRGLLEASIDVPGTGQIVVATTHLQVGGPGYEDAAIDERRDQATMIVERLQRQDAPVVLTGDFNAQPGDAELAAFDGFQDAWRANGNDGEGYTIPASPVEDARQRIDMIYACRAWDVVHSEVVVTDLSRMASDHFPVVADLRLRKR